MTVRRNNSERPRKENRRKRAEECPTPPPPVRLLRRLLRLAVRSLPLPTPSANANVCPQTSQTSLILNENNTSTTGHIIIYILRVTSKPSHIFSTKIPRQPTYQSHNYLHICFIKLRIQILLQSSSGSPIQQLRISFPNNDHTCCPFRSSLLRPVALFRVKYSFTGSSA